MRIATIVAVVTLCIATVAAQAPAKLPPKLSGKWSISTPREIGDTLSMTFDGNGQPGPVTGKLTFRGVNCGAQDEPIKATWDGSVLRFDAVHRPNVNSSRTSGECGDGKVAYVLKRKPGDGSFEGEARLGSTSIAVSVTP